MLKYLKYYSNAELFIMMDNDEIEKGTIIED